MALAMVGLSVTPVAPALAQQVAAVEDDRRLSQALPGPIQATVLRVVDGDTLEVRAHVWIGQTVDTLVRVAEIDTPELRARCDEERVLAERARDAARAFAPEGAKVVLHDVALGKFAGRVIAAVRHSDGADLGASLVNSGLAQRYTGGRRMDWCAAR